MTYILYLTRKNTVLQHSLIAKSIVRKNCCFSWLYYNRCVDIYDKDLVYIYIPKKDFEDNIKRTKKELKNETIIFKYLKEGEDLIKEMQLFPKKSFKNETRLLTEYRDLIMRFGGYFDFTHYLGKISINLSENAISRLSEFHNNRKIVFTSFFDYLRSIGRKIAKRENIYPGHLDFLTIDEMISLVKSSKTDYSKLQKEREKGCIFITDDKGDRFITKNLKKEKQLFEAKVHKEHNKKLTGTPAAEGIVTGEVIVIDQSTPLRDIPDNMIIVTHGTNPSMTPKLIKAKGIITDEGGILSHAAHVAREHKIPTIIGTKTASKQLKSGDKVTLDANKGIIAIKYKNSFKSS